jgi:hypothetical protein
METYTLNANDKNNVDCALSLYITHLEKENKKLLDQIESNKRNIKHLNETRLKLTGVYYGDKPEFYDEKLKGIWERKTEE